MPSQLIPGNRVTLLETGLAFFPALIQAMDEARCEILLETYIFADDPTGRLIAARLAAAAQRGVSVKVLVDGFGARHFPETLMPGLLAAGVQVQIFRQELGWFPLRRRRLRRLHRKLAVVDAGLGFVGGINIIDDLDEPNQTQPRYDYAVQVEGPVVAEIYAAMNRLWWALQWARFKRRPKDRPPEVVYPPQGKVRARLLIRDSLRHRRDIEDAYLKAIHRAEKEIIMASAYFLPGWRFRHALLTAAERGVKVTLLLQGRMEYLLLHFAAQALYSQLLAGGVRIFEYKKSLLHAKVAVVDGLWATVGSSNIDPLSLFMAREANLVVKDGEFAQQLQTSLEQALAAGAEEVRQEDWRRKPLLQRAFSWLAYGAVRLLSGIAGPRAKAEVH